MLALIRKDLQIEFRTKETLAALLLLGLLTLGRPQLCLRPDQ